MGRSFPMPPSVPLEEQRGDTFSSLVSLMQRLLAPDGCPWDREQDFRSLRGFVMEEACEVIDAIDSGDLFLLREELGDLSLQVVFLAELARADGAFGPDDVLRDIVEKLVRRHPHVFEEGEARTPEEVEAAWAKIKAQEKKNRPLLDNIPRSLPALDGARRISEKVSRVGFDWPDSQGSRQKVDEELGELEEAIASKDETEVEHELGDLLFAIVNYARHLGMDPEVALRKSSDRFRSRFAHVEQRVREGHGDWPRDSKAKPTRGISLDEMEGYWQEAKEHE